MTEGTRFADSRDAVFAAVIERFKSDDDFVFLTNDLGAFGLDELRREFSERVINVGIQEQNLVSVASGLALAGQVPVLYGITAHILGRAYEQIRIDLSYSRVRATVLGMGPGYTYGDDGPTHQAPHDLPLLATLPGVSVYVPTNPILAYHATGEALASPGLSWISVDKAWTSPEHPLDTRRMSGWRTLHEGSQGAILVTGFMTELAAEVGFDYDMTVIEIYRPLPLPESAIAGIDVSKPVIVIEETYPASTILSQLRTRSSSRIPMMTWVFGLPEPNSLGVLDRRAEAEAVILQVRQTCKEMRQNG